MVRPSRCRDPVHKRVDQLKSFFRDYTRGVSTAEVRRLFERDAYEAYAVLTRDQEAAKSEERAERFLEGIRAFFLGLSYKLTPPRRVLFAAALLAALVGLLSPELDYSSDPLELRLDFGPLWFLLSITALVFLLALELVDRVRVRDELEVARELQGALLPQRAPELAGWALAHSYRTANEVGGDYYGFPVLPDGRVALMIGDASGHGMAAGLLMAIADATLKTALDLDPEPRRVAEVLNRTLCRTGGRRAFMTFFYALLDPATGHLDYVCAGHPFPLYRDVHGTVREVGEGGLPLGLREALEPPTGALDVEAGEALLLYTDGIAETVNAAGAAFGFERLRRIVNGGDGAAELHRRLVAAFESHVGETSLTDDVTLLVVERIDPRRPVPPPPPPPPR